MPHRSRSAPVAYGKLGCRDLLEPHERVPMTTRFFGSARLQLNSGVIAVLIAAPLSEPKRSWPMVIRLIAGNLPWTGPALQEIWG